MLYFLRLASFFIFLEGDFHYSVWKSSYFFKKMKKEKIVIKVDRFLHNLILAKEQVILWGEKR